MVPEANKTQIVGELAYGDLPYANSMQISANRLQKGTFAHNETHRNAVYPIHS